MIGTQTLTKPKKASDRKPRWQTTGYLVNPSTVIHTKNIDLTLYAKAYMWFHKIADFRTAEMGLMYEKTPDRQRRSEHRQIIELLIQEGEGIIRRIHADGGLIKAENGFSVEDIESAVEELRNTKLQWYGGMAKKRKDAILNGLLMPQVAIK